ncbi:hypothetical protein [Alkalihalobacillus sp. CinArs1]|uniref:hypothetical protein n=1 Tax=Alkalihalobacillus sp. CinArs1 TaxID=2995314 RepID=UPI0022DDB16C|nr:hypothetical protein [Alkalihalobacillus sp. CinArs1]
MNGQAIKNEEVIDFKKLTLVEVEGKIEELQVNRPQSSKLVVVTDSMFIEGEFAKELAEDIEKEPILGAALQDYELNPAIDVTDKQLFNVAANVYMKNVTITQIGSPDSKIHLDEFVVFSDHILGYTVK